MAAARESLFPEVQAFAQELRYGSGEVLVVMIIPSHDKDNRPISTQPAWTEQEMHLLNDLYGGATAFETLAGIFKDSRGKVLNDKPVLVESYASRTDVENTKNLERLVGFLKKMGREAKQSAVVVVIGSAFHKVTDFGEPSA